MSGNIRVDKKEGSSVAAIAMDFVYVELVDCVMSLYTVPNKVEDLVSQLFKVPFSFTKGCEIEAQFERFG
jgi:hypothetical protein